MSNFKLAPWCRRAQIYVLTPVHDQAGHVATWIGRDIENFDAELPAGTLADRGHAILTDQGGQGAYAVLKANDEPLRCDIDRRTGTVRFEDESEMPLDEFEKTFVRVKKDGTYICSFAEDLSQQKVALAEAGPVAHLHSYDLAEAYALARDDGLTRDTGLYEIISSELKDNVGFVDRITRGAGALAASDVNPGLFAALAGAGVHWHEIKDMPQYGLEQVRALFSDLLRPYIGNAPIERVMRFEAFGPVAFEPVLRALGQFAREGATREKFSAPNIMPGYETSEVHVFEAEGVQIIAFSDPMGSYAYAWPAELALTPEKGLDP